MEFPLSKYPFNNLLIENGKKLTFDIYFLNEIV